MGNLGKPLRVIEVPRLVPEEAPEVQEPVEEPAWPNPAKTPVPA